MSVAKNVINTGKGKSKVVFKPKHLGTGGAAKAATAAQKRRKEEAALLKATK